MTSHALRTIRPHRTRYRRKVEALRHTVATPAVRGAESLAAQPNSVNAREELRDRPESTATVTSGSTTDLDPMQSSDERRFWSAPAPERREYDVHYVMRRRPRLVSMGEMVGASLFIGFVLFIATAIVAWLVWQVLV